MRRKQRCLFGAGLHARNGLNPIVSRKIYISFVLPRLLYGSELWMITAKLLCKLETFQINKLKQLQGLPDRTSNIAVRSLLGILPIEAEIDKRVLSLFRNLINDPDCIEYRICQRQLAMKNGKSKSWFIYVDKILSEYLLPSAHILLQNTPTKQEWKKKLKDAVSLYWNNKILREIQTMNSIRFLSIDTLNCDKIALVWSSSVWSLNQTKKAFVKVKILSGCYKLQAHEALFKRNQHQVSSLCRLCNQECEDRKHFILKCSTLDQYRQCYIDQLSHLLCSIDLEYVLHDDDLMLQILLDVNHQVVPDVIKTNTDFKLKLEKISQDWLYALHVNRWEILHRKLKN